MQIPEMKIQTVEPVFTEFIPQDLEDGKLYISEKYEVAIHLCACGCGGKAVTPIGPGEWRLTKNGDKISLSPSIGNWSGEKEYHAHYFITDNKIISA